MATVDYVIPLSTDECLALEHLVELGRFEQGGGELPDNVDDALVTLNDKLEEIVRTAKTRT